MQLARPQVELLAEMGATVIKVEPFTGDEQRTQGLQLGV